MSWQPKYSVQHGHAEPRGDRPPVPSATDGAATEGAEPGRPALRETLSGQAKALMNALPEHINVTAIALDYPHVMNRIANAWSDARVFEQLVMKLLIDDRGDREGFPFAVADALADLRIHRQSVADEAMRMQLRR